MICKYCNQECQTIMPNGADEFRIGHCEICDVGYFTKFHAIYGKANGKIYYVLCRDGYPNENTSIYHYGLAVVQFQHHIQFTPSSFQDKLKMLLLFS